MKNQMFDNVLTDIATSARFARMCFESDDFKMCKEAIEVIKDRIALAEKELPKLETAFNAMNAQFDNLPREKNDA